MPVEAVIVIADRREEADDEPARAARLEHAGAEVEMLPQDAVILLVQADGVAHEEGLAMVVRHGDVEIADMAEAIAAELELVRELAEAVFAGVEGALPVMVGGRVRIGNDSNRFIQ